MTGQPERLRDLLPEVFADLAARHLAANGEPPEPPEPPDPAVLAANPDRPANTTH